jgi:hypothetical protein
VILLVAVAGCGTTVPSLSPSPAPTSSLVPDLSPAAPPTHSPPVSPTELPSSPKAELTDLAVDTNRIAPELTRNVEAFVSLGDEVVWSGGATDDAEDLYRFVPGSAGPELLYQNPEPDSVLTAVRGSSAGYVFTEERWRGGKPDGWRLWFLDGPGGEPVMLDQSTDAALPPPTIAMDGDWIAWEVVHGTINDHLNELFAARVDGPLHPLKLRSFEGRAAYIEFPTLWGDELWYGVVGNDWIASTEQPRVEMIDLRTPAAPPVVFGADQRAFMPAPGRDVVAWKSGGGDDLAAPNSGTLTLYFRATGEIETLPIPGAERLAQRISYPSVGNRFVAWWDEIRQRLYVYDLAERQFRRIAEYSLESGEVVARPSLSGDLLAYLHYLPSGERYLEWARLPD